ncbi:MAG: hypothetical protein P1U68_07265 [Verrucomicrobiales bacterium]|nr:hypothetical protein [Verrucomicrobiales bacterium]
MQRRSIFILVIVSALVLAGGFAAYVKREGIKYRISNWRAASLVEKSRKLGGEGKWEEASEVSLAAWQLDRGNIEVVRQLYRASLKNRSPHLLVAARTLFSHSSALADERLEVIRLYLGLGDHVTVASLLAQLTPEERTSPDAMQLGAEFLIVRNRPIEALKLLEELRKNRVEPGDSFLVASALARLSSEDDVARREAQRLIDELINQENGPQIAFSAFRLLEVIPEKNWDLKRFQDIGLRLREILAEEEIPLFVHFLEARLQIAADPAIREQVLSSIVSRFFDTHRSEVGDWLISRNEIALVQKTMAGADVENDPVNFSILIKSYFRDGNWEAASELLSKAPTELDPAMLFALRAVVATAVGERSNAKNWWERALRQAGLASGRGGLLTIAKIAASAGNESVRNRAVTEALKRRSAIPIPASDVSFIFSHLVEDDAGSDLLDISLGMLAGEPDNPLLVNNVAWLTLMNRRSVSGLMDKLENLVGKFKKPAGLYTTLALAYHFEGQFDEAARVITTLSENLKADEFSELSDTDLAVIELVQRDSDLSVVPEGLPDRLKWGGMMAIEREFFQEALGEPENSEATPGQ